MTEENEGKNKKKINGIDITLDTSKTEALARENERLKMEKEKNEPSLNDLKIQAVQKFGRPDLFLDAESKESLSARLTNYINELAKNSNPKPSGTAPANAQQYGQKSEDLYTKPYSSHQEMVEDLRKKSAEGNPEAKQYLDSLIKKWILDKRENPTRPEPSYNPNSPESLLDLDLVEKNGFLTPRNKEDSEIGQLQKRWREERKRRMEGKSD
jgi:hypothetical protein